MGGAVLLFTAWKLALRGSVVVHAEPGSIHRRLFGWLVVRFPQEPFNLVDFLTGQFLILGGAIALCAAAGLSRRLEAGGLWDASSQRSERAFFRVAGIGLVWLGFDELFLVHEFLSANLFVSDAGILLVYGVVAAVAGIAWRRLLLSCRGGPPVLVAGGLLHVMALACDLFGPKGVWLPEEPLEMLAAGCYALALALYAATTLARAADPALRPTGLRGETQRSAAV